MSARRRELAQSYRERLRSVDGIEIPWDDDAVERSAHFGFPIVVATPEERERVVHDLASRGVQTTCYPAIPNLTAYRDHPRRPVAEDISARHLLLPLASMYTEREVERVVDAADRGPGRRRDDGGVSTTQVAAPVSERAAAGARPVPLRRRVLAERWTLLAGLIPVALDGDVGVAQRRL